MIVTPPGFLPLATPLDHPQPRTFAFRGGELLLREPDLALPDARKHGKGVMPGSDVLLHGVEMSGNPSHTGTRG